MVYVRLLGSRLVLLLVFVLLVLFATPIRSSWGAVEARSSLSLFLFRNDYCKLYSTSAAAAAAAAAAPQTNLLERNLLKSRFTSILTPFSHFDFILRS